jgi:hypothetical protein
MTYFAKFDAYSISRLAVGTGHNHHDDDDVFFNCEWPRVE